MEPLSSPLHATAAVLGVSSGTFDGRSPDAKLGGASLVPRLRLHQRFSGLLDEDGVAAATLFAGCPAPDAVYHRASRRMRSDDSGASSSPRPTSVRLDSTESGTGATAAALAAAALDDAAAGGPSDTAVAAAQARVLLSQFQGTPAYAAIMHSLRDFANEQLTAYARMREAGGLCDLVWVEGLAQRVRTMLHSTMEHVQNLYPYSSYGTRSSGALLHSASFSVSASASASASAPTTPATAAAPTLHRASMSMPAGLVSAGELGSPTAAKGDSSSNNNNHSRNTGSNRGRLRSPLMARTHSFLAMEEEEQEHIGQPIVFDLHAGRYNVPLPFQSDILYGPIVQPQPSLLVTQPMLEQRLWHLRRIATGGAAAAYAAAEVPAAQSVAQVPLPVPSVLPPPLRVSAPGDAAAVSPSSGPSTPVTDRYSHSRSDRALSRDSQHILAHLTGEPEPAVPPEAYDLLLSHFECEVMRLLQPVSWGVAAEDGNEDCYVATKLEAIQHVTPDELQVPAAGQNPWMLRSVSAELWRLNMVSTPEAKLECLQAAASIIVRSLQLSARQLSIKHPASATSFGTSSSVGAPSGGVGADDFLPCLIWCLKVARPAHLASHLAYLERFRDPSLMAGRAGYVFVNVRSALYYLLTLDQPQDEA